MAADDGHVIISGIIVCAGQEVHIANSIPKQQVL